MGTRPQVLITGASAGIGEQLAIEFASRQHPLILVARRLDPLTEVAAKLSAQYHVEVAVIAQDLALKKSTRALLATLAERDLQVDVLVNNAGLAEIGRFQDLKPDLLDQMIQLNVGAVAHLTRAILPGMLARGYGRILNVASVAAFQAVPVMGAYAATKAFVLSLTESLAEELAGTDVRVAALCPGLTNTDMAEQFGGLGEELGPLRELMMGDVRQVAREGYDACMAGDVVRVPGMLNRVATTISQTQPRWLVRRIGGLLSRELFRRTG